MDRTGRVETGRCWSGEAVAVSATDFTRGAYTFAASTGIVLRTLHEVQPTEPSEWHDIKHASLVDNWAELDRCRFVINHKAPLPGLLLPDGSPVMPGVGLDTSLLLRGDGASVSPDT